MSNVCRQGKPTARDLAEIADFKRYLQIRAEGEDVFHLSAGQAARYAGMEVYGDVFCERRGLDEHEFDPHEE